MSELLRRAVSPGTDGATVRVDPATEPAGLGGVGWHWISFAAHELVAGASLRRSGDDREVGVVVLEGRLRLRAGGRVFGEVGSRASVFEPIPAPVLLVEPGAALEIARLQRRPLVGRGGHPDGR